MCNTYSKNLEEYLKLHFTIEFNDEVYLLFHIRMTKINIAMGDSLFYSRSRNLQYDEHSNRNVRLSI